MTAIESVATVQLLSIGILLVGETTGAHAVSAAGATASASANAVAFVVMTVDLARGTRAWTRLDDHSTDGTVPRAR